MTQQKHTIEETVLTHIEDGIGTLTLNRPERLNCISVAMLEALIGKMESLLNDERVKVLVLTGAGRAFCAGADQGEMVPRDAQEWERLVERYLAPIRLIANSTKPVIASINGDAVGGGLGLAIACDLRIAADTARYCAPFVAIGLAGCDMSAGYFLPRLLGLGKATDLMMTARFVASEEAERIGLVQRIVPAAQLAGETEKLARKLASYSSAALGWTKKAIRRSLDRDMESEFDYEVLAQVQCLQTQEHRDALKAYQSAKMGKKKSE